MESNKCVALSFHQGHTNFVWLIFINGSTTQEYQIRFENKKHLFACVWSTFISIYLLVFGVYLLEYNQIV